MKFPKFEEKVREKVVDTAVRQELNPSLGVVLAYEKESNTATVLAVEPGTHLPGEIFTGVLCPVQLGVQSVAPEPGRECWLEFREGTHNNPVITHYFNHAYEQSDYNKHYYTNNELPRFMTEL